MTVGCAALLQAQTKNEPYKSKQTVAPQMPGYCRIEKSGELPGAGGNTVYLPHPPVHKGKIDAGGNTVCLLLHKTTEGPRNSGGNTVYSPSKPKITQIIAQKHERKSYSMGPALPHSTCLAQARRRKTAPRSKARHTDIDLYCPSQNGKAPLQIPHQDRSVANAGIERPRLSNPNTTVIRHKSEPVVMPSTKTNEAGPSAAAAKGGNHPPANPSAKPPGAPMNNSKKRNAKRNARKIKRRLQGPLHPHASRIWGEDDAEISLVAWRKMKGACAPYILDAVDKMLIDDPTNENARDVCVEEWIFVERTGAHGDKTSTKPPEERFGHGLLLYKNLLSKEIAERAFRECVGIIGKDGKTCKPSIKSGNEDTRAVYTMCVDKWAWGACAPTIWQRAQRRYGDKFPEHIGIEMVNCIDTKRNAEQAILVLHADSAWEKALDDIGGCIRLGIGTFKARKRRHGLNQNNARAMNEMEIN